MNNPIFNALNNPFGNIQNLIGQFQQFRRTFNGDPERTINQMLQDGRITQAQLNQAKEMAKQFQAMMR